MEEWRWPQPYRDRSPLVLDAGSQVIRRYAALVARLAVAEKERKARCPNPAERRESNAFHRGRSASLARARYRKEAYSVP